MPLDRPNAGVPKPVFVTPLKRRPCWIAIGGTRRIIGRMKGRTAQEFAQPLHDIGQKSAAERYAMAMDSMHIAQNILSNQSQGRRLVGCTKLPEHQQPKAAIQYLRRNGPDIPGLFVLVHRNPAKCSVMPAHTAISSNFVFRQTRDPQRDLQTRARHASNVPTATGGGALPPSRYKNPARTNRAGESFTPTRGEE